MPLTLQPTSLADAPAQLHSRAAEVSSVALGGHVLSTSDEWFAPASDLLKVAPAPSLKGQFGPKGAKFDGWETRRHNPLPQKYDWVILRLGPAPGAHILGLDIDTANFNGNEAPEVEVHALAVDPDAEAHGKPAHIDEDDPRWTALLPRTPCGPSQQHLYASANGQPSTEIYTHIKLVMVPDGGIARFRVYGTIPAPPPGLGIGEHVADPARPHLNTLDLAHVLNGGRVIFTSDQHFGAGTNLIIPGRGADMGDGWETKRSRHPAHKDWVVIQLAQRAFLTSAEIDTIHFLGNFPDSVELHALDVPSAAAGSSLPASEVAKLADADERVAGWRSILPATKVGPGKQHFFDLQPEDRAGDTQPITHVRVTMHPDGGIKRVRLVGRRADLVASAKDAGPLPTVPLPTPATSSSHARAGLYPIPASYPVTGKSLFDSELRALLRAAAGSGSSNETDQHSPADTTLNNASSSSSSGRGPAGAGTGAGAGAMSSTSSTARTGTSTRLAIRAEPLTPEAYAPFGSVIAGPSPHSTSSASSSDPSPAGAVTVNQGTASKFLSLAPITSLYPPTPTSGSGPDRQPSARAHIHVYRSTPRFALDGSPAQPSEFTIEVLERHRFTTQAFLPLTPPSVAAAGEGEGGGKEGSYLVIVALPQPSTRAAQPGARAPDASPTTTTTSSSSSSSSSTTAEPHIPAAHERGPDLATLRAFWAASDQGISYHPGTWHHPLVAVGSRAHVDFACVVHESVGEPALDCDEVFFGDGKGAGRACPVVLL